MSSLFQRLLRYLKRIQPREATVEELLAVHTEDHIRNYFAPLPPIMVRASTSTSSNTEKAPLLPAMPS